MVFESMIKNPQENQCFDLSVHGFEWDAMIHADRFANAGRLLTVAAFAVYVQIKPLSLPSKLGAPASSARLCFDLSVHGSLLSRKL